MHDSPSSPRRSIAPAPPTKQQQTKKAGAPKAKGAVRAKSGCYTCRIRRKVGHLAPPPPFLGPTDPRCPVLPVMYIFAYSHRVPLPPPSPSRNATNDRMQRAVARRVSVSASNASALARSAPIGSRYAAHMLAAHCISVSHLFFFFFSHRKTIMSPSSVRRSRTSWRRRE